MNKRFIAMMLMLTMIITTGTSGTNVYSAVSEEETAVTLNASTLVEDLLEASPDASLEDESEAEASAPLEEAQISDGAENLEGQQQEIMDGDQMRTPEMVPESEEVDEEIFQNTEGVEEETVPQRIYDFVIQSEENLLQASMATDPEWPNPGAIYLEKKASSMGNNTWEMMLLIRGMDFLSTNDIAIVIDNANTLNPYLTNIKAAAKKFGDTLLTEGASTRIMVVNYGVNGIENTQYYTYDELTAYKNYIDSIKQDISSGSLRNLQALIHKADRALYDMDPLNQKNMVVLGSSAPTLSFPFVASGNLTGCTLDHKKLPTVYNENIEIPGDFIPDYTRTISSITGEKGFEINVNAFVDVICQEHGETVPYPYGTWAYDSGGNLILTKGATGTDNGFGAIWEARVSTNRGTNIFTISFDDDQDIVNVLRKMASSPSNYYSVASNNDLASAVAAFDIIASKVSIAAKNGTVTDPMGELVDLIFSGSTPTYTTALSDYESGNADIYISQGSLTYFASSETISWKTGNINESQDAVMKYRIRLEEGTGANEGDVILPNGTTTFAYKNFNDDPTLKNFDVPEITVGGETIRVLYYLVNESGEPVNSAGTVVPLVNAQRLDSETYTYIYGTYKFTAKDIENYIYYGYVLDDIQTPDTKTVDITTSEVTGSPTLWFGYYPGKSSFKIIKEGSEDSEQHFIFRVQGDKIDLQVTIKGNGSLIIQDLPVGRYTVTELTKWSWRYEPDEKSKIVNTIPKTTSEVVFENTRTFGKWLSGDSWISNLFRSWIN